MTAGVYAVSGMIAKPFASVVNDGALPPPGTAMLTLAPATGAPDPSRVTHTSDPCGETLALMARSVTCATTPRDVVRASRVPGRSVYAIAIAIGPRLSGPPSTASGCTICVAGRLAAAVGLTVVTFPPAILRTSSIRGGWLGWCSSPSSASTAASSSGAVPSSSSRTFTDATGMPRRDAGSNRLPERPICAVGQRSSKATVPT